MLTLDLTFCCTDYIQHIGSTIASLSPCSLPQRLYRQAQSLLRSLLPWSNIASKTGIQYSRTMWCDSNGWELPQNQHSLFLNPSLLFIDLFTFFLQEELSPSLVSGNPAAGWAARHLNNIPDLQQILLKIQVCLCSFGQCAILEIKLVGFVELYSLCTIPDTEKEISFIVTLVNTEFQCYQETLSLLTTPTADTLRTQ